MALSRLYPNWNEISILSRHISERKRFITLVSETLSYLLIPNDISMPFLLEYSYLNEPLFVMGKLDNSSCLHVGQLYSVSEISDNSSRYFLLRQVTVHIHWSHMRNIFSMLFGLFLAICIKKGLKWFSNDSVIIFPIFIWEYFNLHPKCSLALTWHLFREFANRAY